MKRISEILQERKECKAIQRERAEQRQKEREKSVNYVEETLVQRAQRIMRNQEPDDEKYFDIFDLYWYIIDGEGGYAPKLFLAYKKNDKYFDCRTNTLLSTSKIITEAFKFNAPQKYVKSGFGNIYYNNSVETERIFYDPATREFKPEDSIESIDARLRMFGFYTFFGVTKKSNVFVTYQSDVPSDERWYAGNYTKKMKYIMSYDNDVNIELGTAEDLDRKALDDIENEEGELVSQYYITSKERDKLFEKPKICVSMTGLIKAEDELNNLICEYYDIDNKKYAETLDKKRNEELEKAMAAEERRKKILKIQERIV